MFFGQGRFSDRNGPGSDRVKHNLSLLRAGAYDYGNYAAVLSRSTTSDRLKR